MMYIMSGLPGFGKSTWIQNYLKGTPEGINYTICSADNYFIKSNGEYIFDPTKIREAHSFCFEKCWKSLRDSIDLVFVDNTNLEAWEISPYVALANMFGVTYKIIKLVASPGEMRKVFERNIHKVPEGKFVSLAQKSLYSPWPKFWDVEEVRIKL